MLTLDSSYLEITLSILDKNFIMLNKNLANSLGVIRRAPNHAPLMTALMSIKMDILIPFRVLRGVLCAPIARSIEILSNIRVRL